MGCNYLFSKGFLFWGFQGLAIFKEENLRVEISYSYVLVMSLLLDVLTMSLVMRKYHIIYEF